MTLSRTYATAGAFRRALEERLRTAALAEQVDLNRLRRQVAFDRLLARLFQDPSPPWALKGGYALELRFKGARTTIDIDLTVPHVSATGDTSQTVREMVQDAASIDLGDWFEYIIGAPVMDLSAAPYGGARCPVEARMDERIFVRFHLDAGIGDVVLQPPEVTACRDWLGFAGIAVPKVVMIAREQQLAEKLHVYTLPRSTPNSRVKDLVDLVLLIEAGDLNKQRVADALRVTFERRKTHDLPVILPSPPSTWQSPFAALAKDCGISHSLSGSFVVVQTYLESAIRSAASQ
jgi:hypothetical protein